MLKLVLMQAIQCLVDLGVKLALRDGELRGVHVLDEAHGNELKGEKVGKGMKCECKAVTVNALNAKR